METQYILIRKNKSEAKRIRIQSEVKNVLKDASFDVGDNVIYFSEENKERYVTYRMSYDDNNVLYLNIETSLSDSNAAKLLDEFDNQFVKGYHRRKFYIINAYSDASYWLCVKLMPKVGLFERLLREFIYLTVTKVYGSEWIKNLDFEIRNYLEKTSHGEIKERDSLIEESLEWLDFNAIKDLLFTPRIYYDINEDSIISEVLSNESLTREEIISQIKMLEKKTLWEREFMEFSEINDLPIIFDDIRKIRNTVMHNKTIDFQYYEASISKIQIITKQLEKSIEKIEKEIYNKPKNRRTIVYDGKVFVEAFWKSIQKEEEIERKAELGKNLTERLNQFYGASKISDLIESKASKSDMITKKIGNG